MRSDGWPFADSALAQRIESAEAEAAADYAQAMARIVPGLGAESLSVGGGVATFTGGARASRVFGLGLCGPVLEAELDEIEAFYARHRAPTVIDLCPLADSSLREMLGQRGYRLTDFSQIWIRRLSPEEPFEEVAGVEVRAVGPEEAELWARTVEQGFTGEEEIPEERIERGKGLFQMGYARCYLARIAGVPEGGAAMVEQEGLVTLFATSTRPRARRRGVYTALLRARLAAAAAAGCDLALVITQAGSDSQRNAERMGFRLAYTKVELTRAG